MKSDTYKLDGSMPLPALLSEVERIGLFAKLSENNALKLRLLAEEMIGLIDHILERHGGAFWIENRGGDFELHLTASAFVNIDQRDKLVSASSRHENAAAKGILGKINSVFQNFLMGEKESAVPIMSEGLGFFDVPAYSYLWSMQSYQRELPEARAKEEWDGLEKSILLKMADDVIIGVKSNETEMVVKARFA